MLACHSTLLPHPKDCFLCVFIYFFYLLGPRMSHTDTFTLYVSAKQEQSNFQKTIQKRDGNVHHLSSQLVSHLSFQQ